MLDHLKEFCEVYLSDSSVINLQNIVDLYFVAWKHNASQLKDVCVFQMTRIFDVVSQMEEWRSLEEDAKKDFEKIYGRSIIG